MQEINCLLLPGYLNTTGFPEVGVTPLIAHISLMPGPITKPFDSMKVKTGRIFLVYDKSSYWLHFFVFSPSPLLRHTHAHMIPPKSVANK